MNTPIMFWDLMVTDPKMTCCATRYSTNDVPDVVFWMPDGEMWRGTWSQIDNSPTFWMTRITPQQWHNILP